MIKYYFYFIFNFVYTARIGILVTFILLGVHSTFELKFFTNCTDFYHRSSQDIVTLVNTVLETLKTNHIVKWDLGKFSSIGSTIDLKSKGQIAGTGMIHPRTLCPRTLFPLTIRPRTLYVSPWKSWGVQNACSLLIMSPYVSSLKEKGAFSNFFPLIFSLKKRSEPLSKTQPTHVLVGHVA